MIRIRPKIDPSLQKVVKFVIDVDNIDIWFVNMEQVAQ